MDIVHYIVIDLSVFSLIIFITLEADFCLYKMYYYCDMF